MGTLHALTLTGLFAAEEAAHQAGGGLLAQLGIQFPLIVTQAVGFLLLYFVLRAVAFRPILAILAQREALIRERYQNAEQAQQAAERLRLDYEMRLARIDQEARDRIQEGIREGQAMRAEILSQAQQERERILRQAREEIEADREKMVYSVRETVINMAIEAAGRILARSMDEQAQRLLVQEFLSEIATRPGGEARA